MQWLAAICIRRPVFTWVLIVALVVVGFAGLQSLGVDRFPRVDFPIVVVTTRLPGATPEQVETEVTDRLEAAVNSVSGLDQLRSVSYEGLSVVTAQFVLDKDVAVAAQEVRDHVDRVLADLPEQTEAPQVLQVDPDAAPVMLVAVQGPGGIREVTDIAERVVRRRLESVAGVGQATVLGGRPREIAIEVDPVKMESFGVSVADVEHALAAENVDVPGGTLVQGTRSRLVRVEGRIDTVPGFENMVVAERGSGLVRLGDVAKVSDTAALPSSVATLNGHEVVVVSVSKQSGTNTVAVVDALRESIASIGSQLPKGYRVDVVRDESAFIRNAVAAVEEHLVLGSICVAIVVLVFLSSWRATVISAIAIPASIVATFAFVRAMGLTLNTLTLLALTLAVGIVIDDAIVVLENIVRFLRDRDLPPREAALQATAEIGLAVLATTLSLIAVFLPIAFMGGIVGRFMRSFGLTMSFAVAVSLFVSFTLTPMLSARWLDARRVQLGEGEGGFIPHGAPTGEERFEGKGEERRIYREWQRGERVLEGRPAMPTGRGWYARFERLYMRVLAVCMRRRWIVYVGMALALAAIVPLVAIVPKNFLPNDDESRFELYLRLPEGTSLDETRIFADRVARDIRAIPGVDETVLTVGSPPGDPSGRAANEASLYVGLTDPSARRLSQQDVIERVRQGILPGLVAKNPGLRAIVTPVNVFGGSGTQSATIQYVLRGPDLDALARYSQELLARAKKIPGVIEANTTLVTGRPELAIRVDRSRAADLGVTVADAANAVRVLVGGERVSTFIANGERYDVELRAQRRFRDDPDALRHLYVPASGGRTVPLAEVATLDDTTGPASIERLSRQREVTVYANVTPGTSEAAVIAALDRARADLHLPPAYHAELVGRSRELGRAGSSFATAFGLSLAFMFLVLAAQFESVSLPIAILVSLPMTLPFALFSLVVLGQSLNIFSALGILVLFGVVKKNGILQLDHVRELRRMGLTRADAVMIGNRHRLRPILMTTFAFVAGMIPLVVSSGAGAGTNRAMGSVIMGGQLLALLLTLLATPVVYVALDDASHSKLVGAVGRAARWPGERVRDVVDRVRARRARRREAESPAE